MTHILGKRKGVASIFGAIMFIGILFGSIVPMFISMRQSDTIYNQKKSEMNALDLKRQREDVAVTSYPANTTGHTIIVEGYNIGPVDVKIIRVWINEMFFNVDPPQLIKPFNHVKIGEFDPGLKEADQEFNTCLVSDMGNKFSDPLTLIYKWVEGGGFWDVDAILINVLIDSIGSTANENYIIIVKRFVDGSYVKIEEASASMRGGATIKPFDLTEYGFGQKYKITVYKNNINQAPICDTYVDIGNINIHWVTAYGYS